VAAALWCVRAGTVGYPEASAAQGAIAAARRAGELPDVLVLLQHPPVYTRGRRSEERELPMGTDWYRMQGIEVEDTDRGGRVTYHGPGQLVAYPIVDLRPAGGDVHSFVRGLERAMIAALGDWGVRATVFEGLTGVWTAGAPPLPVGEIGPQGTRVRGPEPPGDATAREARKIGSIGIHVSGGITTHGLAVNVSNDLQPFEWIVPCGIEAARMTSLTRELGREQQPAAFADTLAARLAAVMEREPVEVAAEALAARIPGAAALAGAVPAGAPPRRRSASATRPARLEA
jgi:lipoyl(octanoyl) transferase